MPAEMYPDTELRGTFSGAADHQRRHPALVHKARPRKATDSHAVVGHVGASCALRPGVRVECVEAMNRFLLATVEGAP